MRLLKIALAAALALVAGAALAQYPNGWDNQTPVSAPSPLQWLSNLPHRILTTDAIWGAAVPVNLGTVSSGAIQPNFCQYANAQVTLGATGLALSRPSCIQAGQVFILELLEDNTGSRTITTYDPFYKFSGGTKPTLSTGANAKDVLQCWAESPSVGICSFSSAFS